MEADDHNGSDAPLSPENPERNGAMAGRPEGDADGGDRARDPAGSTGQDAALQSASAPGQTSSAAAGADSDDSDDDTHSVSDEDAGTGSGDADAARDDADEDPETAADGGSDDDSDEDSDGDSDDASGGGADEDGPEKAAAPPAVIDPAVVERLRRHHVAPAFVALDRIDDDDTYRLRPDGDLALLATDIARLGQLFPVDLRPVGEDRFQVICGFRRVAALRFLQRDRVVARLHSELSDSDALLMSLAAGVHGAQVSREELEAVRDRLAADGRLEPAARDLLEKALSDDDSLAPEGVEEEVDAEELADDITQRLGAINQDLSLIADVFGALDPARKEELIKQLKYSADLVAFLEGQ